MPNTSNKQLTITQISDILESGEFDKFIGIEENEHLEAKRKRPYDFAAGTTAFAEFAKDVANIANGDYAAFIILGLITQKSHTAKTDEIIALDLMKESEMYSETDIAALIKQCVYPKLEIKQKWYPSKTDSAIGLGVLFIEKQPEDKKYFIAKVVETNGTKLSGYFGIPVRKGSDTTWLPYEELYTAAKKTPTKTQDMFVQISGQLEEIKGKLSANTKPKVNLSKKLDLKIEEALNER